MKRSMVCFSHEPYYFSTRWNTNIPIVIEANQFFHCFSIDIKITFKYIKLNKDQ